MPSVSGGIYQGVSEHVVLKTEESLETGKGKHKDLSQFEKGQTVMARLG